MQGTVANRSLFKNKSGARDKLRSLGGIMASSEPLLEEAYRSIDTPKQSMPPKLLNNTSGIMSSSPVAPPSMSRMPPQMPPPPQIAPTPQMQPQSTQTAPPPIQPAPVAPPAPGLNPMAQVPGKPPGLALGGFYQDPETRARLAANSAPRSSEVDVTQTAGTVSFNDMTADQAKKLGSETLSGSRPFKSPFTEMNVGDKAPELSAAMMKLGGVLSDSGRSAEEKSRAIAAFTGGNPEAKDMKKEMVKVAKDTFGKKLNSNDKIDGLNRAITGFAIAAGTSPRASVNFANGMLVGLGEMKKTEVGRQNAAAVAANAAAGGGVSGEKSRQEFRYNAVFADAFKAALEENPDDQQAALRVATEIARGAAPDAPSAQGGGSGSQAPAVDTSSHIAANDAAKKDGKTTYNLGGTEFEVQA